MKDMKDSTSDISVSTWRMWVGFYNSLQIKEACQGSYWRKTLLGELHNLLYCCHSIKLPYEVEKFVIAGICTWCNTFFDFHLIVHSWRMWQMFYHCLQLKNTYQSTLPDRHPHVQIWRLWQNIPHCTQVKGTWEETSGWPETIQMRDRGVRQSVLCSWNFDIPH